VSFRILKLLRHNKTYIVLLADIDVTTMWPRR